MTDEEFEHAVLAGIEALPEWARGELRNVAFLIVDEPSSRESGEDNLGKDEMLFGLYEGVPLSLRGNDSPMLPDTITLFKKPILCTYTDKDDIRACIENTIWHEVAHYFGHDEEWVEKEEARRGRTK